MKKRKLYLSRENNWIGGVCGGLGEYFGTDSDVIRLIWILVILFGGTGLLLYLILWIFMPYPPRKQRKKTTKRRKKSK